MKRRVFLSSASAVLSHTLAAEAQEQSAPGVNNSSFRLQEATLVSLQDEMKRGSLTAEAATSLYLERIDQLDRKGPALHAVIEINPEALSIARSLDEERKTRGPRGPLHGLPVLLKDNIDTADRMQTTAGSLALLGKPAPQDATIAAKLRAAGAVLLGKTNLSEWANFRSTHSTSGWSGRGGQTKNPYALDRNPCGSSSGSGAAITSNLAAAAIGTETDGSIICPSAMCGIVGIKPTLGLISRFGVIPIAHSQDTGGPMARSVRDAAILLGVLAGPDSRDPATENASVNGYSDYTRFLNPDGLRGMRLGVARQYFTISPSVSAVIDESIALMRRAGAIIIDAVEFPKFEAWRDTETEVLLYEFKADLNRYLSARGAAVKSLADCIAFNRAHREQEMPYFEQELMEQAQEKGPLTEKDYLSALDKNHHLTRKDGIDGLVKKFKLDAIVGPTAGPAWTTDWINGDRVDSGCASPPAVAGYPHITVPAGFVFGLPIGISFFGPAWSEPALLKAAYAFEQMRHARKQPQFRPTVNFSA
ncbi:MAG TPA: amidase [Bryobacteraceae bacterium]|nr:amidase [Bryobacteraceae bacterium]